MIAQPVPLRLPSSVGRARSRIAVAAMATAMPPADSRLPLRAVAGEFIRIRPMTKQEAPASQARRTMSEIVLKSIAQPSACSAGFGRDGLLLEHLEHPVGDHVAADHVHRGEGHGDQRQELAGEIRRLDGDEHRADEDDPVDRVGARHQGRVQGRRHLADDGEADQDRQDEDGQGGQQFGAHAGPPAPAAGAGSSSFLTGSETTAPPWLITVALVTSSSKSRFRLPSLTIPSSRAEMFRA